MKLPLSKGPGVCFSKVPRTELFGSENIRDAFWCLFGSLNVFGSLKNARLDYIELYLALSKNGSLDCLNFRVRVS